MKALYLTTEKNGFQFNHCTMKRFFPFKVKVQSVQRSCLWKSGICASHSCYLRLWWRHETFWAKPWNFLESCNKFIAQNVYKGEPRGLYLHPLVGYRRCSSLKNDSCNTVKTNWPHLLIHDGTQPKDMNQHPSPFKTSWNLKRSGWSGSIAFSPHGSLLAQFVHFSCSYTLDTHINILISNEDIPLPFLIREYFCVHSSHAGSSRSEKCSQCQSALNLHSV